MSKTKQTSGGMRMMPGRRGTCKACYVQHEPGMPHNAQSLSYCMRFLLTYGRDPTWADAIAHCDDQMKRDWMEGLKERGAWTEPADGVAVIAEPMEEQP